MSLVLGPVDVCKIPLPATLLDMKASGSTLKRLNELLKTIPRLPRHELAGPAKLALHQRDLLGRCSFGNQREVVPELAWTRSLMRSSAAVVPAGHVPRCMIVRAQRRWRTSYLRVFLWSPSMGPHVLLRGSGLWAILMVHHGDILVLSGFRIRCPC